MWESGRQSPAQGRGSKRDKGKQAAGERERRLETGGLTERKRERETGRRERYMTSLSLTMALHVVPSLAGELLESGMWNVGFSGLEVIATVWV